MICIENIMVCDINSFSSSVQQLGLEVILTEPLVSSPIPSGNCLTNICLDSTGAGLLSALTPLFIKVAFMVMLWLILHLFYSLIPEEI